MAVLARSDVRSSYDAVSRTAALPRDHAARCLARRASNCSMVSPAGPISLSPSPTERDREIASLQARVQHLEALVARDEDVLRKLLGLLIEKGLASREEILERISS